MGWPYPLGYRDFEEGNDNGYIIIYFIRFHQVRAKLKDCCTRLIQDIPNIRIGIIAHGDYCDAESTYVIRMLDLTSDTQVLVDFAVNVPRTGGGDCEEVDNLVTLSYLLAY
jgi:hypothetical protein